YGASLSLGAWDNLILFTPENQINAGSQPTVNYLSIFLAKGGHLLTEGRSDRTGGLAAALQPGAMVFPMNLRCEITGSKSGCEGDTSGVYSMPYRDYCVTMLDKVLGLFRSDADLPARMDALDALQYAVRADVDPVTAANPAVPATLDLWEEVTKSGRFFDPRVRGYTYVEIYDPKYWMDARQVESQKCFHPMYLMHSRNISSPVNNTAIALWLTKYQNVDPDGPGPGVAAPSVHFGFELWFFDRAEVNQLIDTIFALWGIKAG
ncbi:MAG TPA: hypothetical protein VMT60_01390, partial [Candidatus Bathyarchaeia archaeon]|nr:hypothetical protein [Candidatus Bathyarchaeia archaeon]